LVEFGRDRRKADALSFSAAPFLFEIFVVERPFPFRNRSSIGRIDMSEGKSCGKCKNPCRKCRARRIGELNAEAMAALNAGDATEAEARLREALELAEADDMPIQAANLHNSLALVFSMGGRMEPALTHYAEALDLADGRIRGDHALLQTLHRNLARTLVPAGG
jgi:tetratricopeptide (TPR) repeat protein